MYFLGRIEEAKAMVQVNGPLPLTLPSPLGRGKRRRIRGSRMRLRTQAACNPVKVRQ